VWKSLQHPNVLPLIGVSMSESHFAMVSEWMENGSISDFLKKNPDANPLELVSLWPKISLCFRLTMFL
jgi:serine/threonine protein kinase